MTPHATIARSRLALATAFAIVYVVWGSTYLAILFAIETVPPFLMASARFFIAGVLLLLGGNGLVVWSEQRVPSGMAALLVGTVPCFMVLLDWVRPNGQRPTGRVSAGLVLGLLGLVWLVGPDSVMGGGRADLLGAAALVLASFSWAFGSIWSRQAPMPASPFLSTAMQMLAASVALFVVSLSLGEPWRFDPSAVSLRSWLGLLYLIVLGSLVAFSAYVWLLRVSTPARVSTYAYVNPVVAVLLGAAFAGEALTARMAVAAAVIVSGVALITLAPRRV
jgi:drug/metabolite transporter (DMT)-like permease